jgi:hypothetical protein
MRVGRKKLYGESMGPPMWVRLPVEIDEEIREIAEAERTEVAKIVRRYIEAGQEALRGGGGRPKIRKSA